MFFTCTRSLDEDLDDADDEEENTGFGVTQVNVLNSLDQVRGNVETVYEPFVLQKNSTVHVLWWKCKGFRVSCTAREEGLEVTVTVNPPTDEDLKDVGLDLPAAPLKSMSSKFFLGFGFRVIPNTFKGEQKGDFLIVSIQKYGATSPAVVFD